MQNEVNGRRDFIINSSLVFSALTIQGPQLMNTHKENHNHEVLKKLSSINDQQIEGLIKKQLPINGDRWSGGVKDKFEVPNVHSTFGFIFKLGSAYVVPYSKFYRSERILLALTNAMDCVLNVQHSDGTVDLHSTNFHSTPDTAFMVNYLSPVYVCIKELKDPNSAPLLKRMETFLRNASKCLLVGGAHTANHRWVICSALSRINSFFPSKKYLDRMEDWLAEGIDLDPDGQYTEMSVGSYSSVCDEMFITMGRLLHNEDFLATARKNLEMTLYYIQPGGELLTDASGRQDSEKIAHISGYYYSYRYFAQLDKNPVYSAVCEFIETHLADQITRFIPYLLEDGIFETERVGSSEIPKNYFKKFSHSGVLRIRQSEFDVSIIENNPTFLSLIKGAAVLQSVRLGSTFFGSRGQFTAENIEVKKNQIILTKSVKHGYFQPYPKEKIIGDGVYNKMRREERKLSEAQIINYKLIVTQLDQKIQMEIEVNGTEHVLVSLEMNFRKGGELSGVISDQNRADSYFLKEGWGTYTKDQSVITFGPGKIEHQWGTMRGMHEKPHGNTVYINGHTPFKHVLEIS
jgi:hypothetical protein